MILQTQQQAHPIFMFSSTYKSNLPLHNLNHVQLHLGVSTTLSQVPFMSICTGKSCRSMRRRDRSKCFVYEASYFFVFRDYARETLSLRWRSWMTSYYMDLYLKNQTFCKNQSQSIIDNPDQRIADDLSSFTRTALPFSLILFNVAVDLISFSNILYGIYPPLFVVLLVYSSGGTVISVFLGRDSVTLNFLQEEKEANFRYGLVRVQENAESIAFYGGEESEMQLLLQRFKSAFENLTVVLGDRSQQKAFKYTGITCFNTGSFSIDSILSSLLSGS